MLRADRARLPHRVVQTRVQIAEGGSMLIRSTTLAVTLVILLAAGCGDDDGVVKIGAESSGTTVELAADQTLELRLEANPTTGYEWVVLESGVVELVRQRHKPDSDAAGSGGVTTLTFAPTGNGSADLTLGYMQPWEEDVPPIEIFTVTISVTG
jgi:inhibitor of cysteine peptidase